MDKIGKGKVKREIKGREKEMEREKDKKRIKGRKKEKNKLWIIPLLKFIPTLENQIFARGFSRRVISIHIIQMFITFY